MADAARELGADAEEERAAQAMSRERPAYLPASEWLPDAGPAAADCAPEGQWGFRDAGREAGRQIGHGEEGGEEHSVLVLRVVYSAAGAAHHSACRLPW